MNWQLLPQELWVHIFDFENLWTEIRLVNTTFREISDDHRKYLKVYQRQPEQFEKFLSRFKSLHVLEMRNVQVQFNDIKHINTIRILRLWDSNISFKNVRLQNLRELRMIDTNLLINFPLVEISPVLEKLTCINYTTFEIHNIISPDVKYPLMKELLLSRAKICANIFESFPALESFGIGSVPMNRDNRISFKDIPKLKKFSLIRSPELCLSYWINQLESIFVFDDDDDDDGDIELPTQNIDIIVCGNFHDYVYNHGIIYDIHRLHELYQRLNEIARNMQEHSMTLRIYDADYEPLDHQQFPIKKIPIFCEY